MATRATIKIEGINYAKVYKHWDGYPEGLVGWLTDFNSRFKEARGDDPEYKFAALLRDSVRKANEHSLDDSEYTGWGVIAYDSDWGEEYEYTLKKDGTVEVR